MPAKPKEKKPAASAHPVVESVVFSCRHAVLKILKDAAAHVGGGTPADSILVLNESKSGDPSDLSSPICFALAKDLKKKPAELADAMVERIDGMLPEWISKVEALNGYVNFFYSDAFYAALLSESIAQGERYGHNHSGADKQGHARKAVVEFSDPNIGKPFHVGHLRATIIGESVARLLATNGFDVVRVNYLGDAGAQVAKLLLAIREFKESLPPIVDEKGMFDHYVKINSEIEARPELKEKERALLDLIEKADPAIVKELKFIREKSYEAFQRNYDLLDISFDVVTGESEYIQAALPIVEDCVKKGIAVKEPEKTDPATGKPAGGEIVAKLEDLDPKNGKTRPGSLPNTILLRSNGTTLYATRDLALADYKFQHFAPSRSIILTAAEQNLHFKQVFKILQKLGRAYAQPTHANPNGILEHIGFGLIVLPEGKMSTRKGVVVFLEDILNESIASARAELEKRKDAGHEKAESYSAAQMDEISKKVGIGAMKFAVLKQSAEKDIVFDFARMASFEGDTGAYAQYSLVRAKNILRKASEEKDLTPSAHVALPKAALGAPERLLANLISRYPTLVSSAGASARPHAVCEYALRLCATFSSFYASTPVLSESDERVRDVRLSLVKSFEVTLSNALELLGVPVLEQM